MPDDGIDEIRDPRYNNNPIVGEEFSEDSESNKESKEQEAEGKTCSDPKDSLIESEQMY